MRLKGDGIDRWGNACRILRPAPFVYAGLCELFELYMLHTFHTFSEVSLTDLAAEAGPQVSKDPNVHNHRMCSAWGE